jgi:hypothetical protein
LSHLIREAAITATLSGTGRTGETLLESAERGHAATEEMASPVAVSRARRSPVPVAMVP